MNDFDILALAKANNDAYLTAYKVGYEAGWKEALAKAMEIIDKAPVITRHVTDLRKPA